MAEATAIVTQVRVAARHSLQFASWQQEISDLIALQPGFLSQDVPPPSTVNGVTDWVITQHFASREATQAWLRSDARMQAIAGVQPFLVGQDEVWVLGEGKVAPPPPHASAVIATSIRPGQETAFRTWIARSSQRSRSGRAIAAPDWNLRLLVSTMIGSLWSDLTRGNISTLG
jgi:antibiotic biosynthesis monooxygenase (ABM) superfamily enzyme